MKRFYRAAKRGYDILFSLIGMVLSSPLWLIAAVGIKISSRGPVFYQSERVGKDRRIFLMFKFRSMHVNDAKSATQFVLSGSSLIFPFGAFIRRYKIDELPQLLNILLGDLSVVGPRPCSPINVDDLITPERAQAFFSVKPGLTSPGSLFEYIYGDCCEDNAVFTKVILPIKMEMECWYASHSSFFWDVGITARTAVIICQVALGRKQFAFTKSEQAYISAMGQAIAALPKPVPEVEVTI